MKHDVNIIGKKQVSNDQVAYRVICCGDPFEDTWITLSIHIADHTPQLEEYKQTVATRHAKMVAWREKNTVDHS